MTTVSRVSEQAVRAAEGWVRGWWREAVSTAPLDETGRRRLVWAVRRLYASVGLAPPRVVMVRSPLEALLAGALAAGIVQCRQEGQDIGMPALRDDGDGWLVRAVGEATAGAPATADPATLDHPGDTPGFWSAEDRFVWHATSAAVRQALDRPRLEWVGSAQDSGAPSTPWPADEPDPRRGFDHLSAGLERLLIAAVWQDGTGAAALSPAIAASLGSFDRVRAAVFGPGGKVGRRLARLAMRMLDPGPLDAAGQVALGWARRLRPDAAKAAWAEAQEQAAAGGPRLTHPAFCILSDRPDRLRFDQQGRAHADDGPFCRWRDGLALYAVHGVRIAPRVVEQPETLTLAEIDGETNAEVRRVMIKLFGPARYLETGKARVVDHDERFGTLHRREMPDGQEPVTMIEVVNRTPEPDGRFRHDFLRVPPAVTAAHEAVAWHGSESRLTLISSGAA